MKSLKHIGCFLNSAILNILFGLVKNTQQSYIIIENNAKNYIFIHKITIFGSENLIYLN